jgi:hypothetical protein
MKSHAASTSVGTVLWLTVRGASRLLGLGWLAWVGLAGVGAPWAVTWLGPAGTVALVLAAGIVLAVGAPVPWAGLYRYHLDDVEAVAIGPGRHVLRLPWRAVERLTQDRHTVRLDGGGATLRLPLLPLLRHDALAAVLARVVPDLAAEMWARIEDGDAVRLVPAPGPPARSLAWWAWGPTCLACVATGDPLALALAAGLVAAERVVALLRARLRGVIVHRLGITLRPRWRRFVVPWGRAEIMAARGGLLVGVPDGPCGRVVTAVPNFWAAAPVIEMKAQLGPHAPASVHFRVRRQPGGVAVVGEVEPSA